MSELYCDRDDYILTSSQIIREYYFHKQSFLFPNEIPVLKKYCFYEDAYGSMSARKELFGMCLPGLTPEKTDELIKEYEHKLKELENSVEIKNFFNRINEKFIWDYKERMI